MQLKMDKRLGQEFTGKEMQRANKYKKTLQLIVFREIQVRAIKCHLSVSRKAQMETIYS